MQPQQGQDPRIGMVLQDRYRIVRKLGDGGMGAVYEGEHVVIKRKVAIKVLHSQFAQNPEIVARFHREAEAATAIGHPNIVEVTDMGRFPDGTAYMVLEFLSGRDWSHDIEREGPQPLGKVVHIVSQVCDALSAAHAKGIVHRDLKPENIFLIERAGDPNFAKVLDFGISKITDAGSEDRSLTQTGTALGTPYYMAPEQCQGKKDLDARADIYSLGVILFQALTGQYPFDDESYPMLVLKICTEPPPPIEQYRPDLPPDVCATIYRMLSKDRNQRFASIAEVKAALAPYRHMNDAPVVVEGPSTASRGPSVLEQRASTPSSSTPYPSTPTGTAYLPGSQPQMPAAVAAEPARSSRGPLLAVLAVLGVLVVAGGGVGAAFAFGALGSNASTPPVADAHNPPPELNDEPPSAPTVDPRPAEPQPPPAVAQVPEAPSGESSIQITIEVVGPPSAIVKVNGSSWGTAPTTMLVERDPAPGPGEPPTLHTVTVEADGWHADPLQVPFLVPMVRTITMQRVRGGRPSDPVARPADPPRPETLDRGPTTPTPRPLDSVPPDPPRPTGRPDLADPFDTEPRRRPPSQVPGNIIFGE